MAMSNPPTRRPRGAATRGEKGRCRIGCHHWRGLPCKTPHRVPKQGGFGQTSVAASLMHTRYADNDFKMSEGTLVYSTLRNRLFLGLSTKSPPVPQPIKAPPRRRRLGAGSLDPAFGTGTLPL